MTDPTEPHYTEQELRPFLINCGDCKQDKPASAFPKNRARLTGRGFYCKICHSIRVQAWKRANPEKAGRKPVAP